MAKAVIVRLEIGDLLEGDFTLLKSGYCYPLCINWQRLSENFEAHMGRIFAMPL